MTYKTKTFSALLLLSGTLLSCVGNSNDTITTYDNVAITSVSLGTVKCTRSITKSDGTDSTYTYSYSAASFPIHIDQQQRLIYNTDSLTCGTRLAAILLTISTTNSGTVAWKNIGDESYSLHTTTDSVDLSQDRTLIVFSNDGMQSKEYTVRITAHQEDADSCSWAEIRSNISSRLSSFSKMKLLWANSNLFLLATDDISTTLLKSSDGITWSECPLTGIVSPLSTSTTMAVNKDALLLLNDGNLYQTQDGESWTTLSESAPISIIIGSSTCCYDNNSSMLTEIYGLGTNGKILLSTDNGASWQDDEMERFDNTQKLPVENVNFISSKQNTNSDICRSTVIAHAKQSEDTADTLSVTWNKVVDPYSPQSWFYNSISWENHYYVLPRLQSLTATPYASGIIAAGISPNGAQKNIYYSPDGGATWHTDANIKMPSGILATNAIAMASDNKGYIYILTDGANDSEGQIWRGRKNSETWQRK